MTISIEFSMEMEENGSLPFLSNSSAHCDHQYRVQYGDAGEWQPTFSIDACTDKCNDGRMIDKCVYRKHARVPLPAVFLIYHPKCMKQGMVSGVFLRTRGITQREYLRRK